MTTVNTDIDTIASEAKSLTLVSGFAVNVERLKTRQLMRLLKVLTRGAGPALAEISFGEDTTQEAFTGQLIGTVILSLPEAEDETIEFVQSMVSPANLIAKARSEVDQATNAALYDQLVEELDNPDLEDLVAIVELIVTNEAPHILALGKRLKVLLKLQQNLIAKPEPKKPRSSSKTA